jgi:hypothetical protein
MNTLAALVLNHLETLLRVVALMQFGLAVLSLCLPCLLDWKEEIGRMSLLVREVFEIHAWFIALTLVIWSVMTWRFAPEMAHAPTMLARWLCGAIGFFWGLRAVLQWTHYSASHWRGIRDRTVIHWLLTFGYAAWAGVYFMAAFGK